MAHENRLIAPKEAASEWLLGTAGLTVHHVACDLAQGAIRAVEAQVRGSDMALCCAQTREGGLIPLALHARSGICHRGFIRTHDYCMPLNCINAEMDVGSWSGLDESGPVSRCCTHRTKNMPAHRLLLDQDKLGVGLFFQNDPSTG